MAIFGNGRELRKLANELVELKAQLPAEPSRGETAPSPFVHFEQSRSWLPWRQNRITEADTSPRKAAARSGFLADVPRGGATEFNQGYMNMGGADDRKTSMDQLRRLYLSCTWSSACVDAIARTSSAGGLDIVPDGQTDERDDLPNLSGQAQKAMDLINFINPDEDVRQLVRGIFSDLLVYGDAFVEVSWLMDEPIALWSLPCQDMLIEADEHGVVSHYIQRTETQRRAEFAPREVIHFQFDNPRGGLYGLGPTEKCILPINTWLFTTGLLKSTMARGNPPNVAFKWDVNLSSNEIKKFSAQYLVRNIGPANVGNPVDLIGDTAIHEFAQNKIAEYLETRNQCRDEICAGYGVPPAKVAVIEAGSLGGGTGTAQDKTFRTNTCGPIEELVLEKLTYQILDQGFGVKDHRFKFAEVDWRDDQIIENIRDLRVRRGAWTVNRDRDDIGEPPVQGGDDPVIIERTGMVLVKDLAAMSQAVISGKEAHQNADTLDGPLGGGASPTASSAGPPVVPPISGKAPNSSNTRTIGGVSKGESGDDEDAILEAWTRDYLSRRDRALRELKVGE